MSGPETISGTITGNTHTMSVRVYYEDTDFSGIVYHANYLKFFERGRTEFLRLLDIHHTELAKLDPPLAFAVVDIHIKFKTPARIDDLLMVHTRFDRASGASFHLSQWIEREGVVMAEQSVQAVCIDPVGRPKRLPKDVAARFQALL
jgi:acyl-CoA thioester hydrolase